VSRFSLFAFFDSRVRRIVREETASVRHEVEFNDGDPLKRAQDLIDERVRKMALLDSYFNGARTESAAVVPVDSEPPVPDLKSIGNSLRRASVEFSNRVAKGDSEQSNCFDQVPNEDVLVANHVLGWRLKFHGPEFFLPRVSLFANEPGELAKLRELDVDAVGFVLEVHVSPSSSPKVAESNSPG
jgi:hypothetical protein